MEKNLKILLLLLLSVIFFSCRSIPRTMGPYIAVGEQNAYKNQQQQNQEQLQPQPKEQPQPQEQPRQPQPQPQEQPKPQEQPQEQPTKPNDVREEFFVTMTVSDAPLLKAYSIVVGSFMVQENAKKLTQSLQPDYNPIIVINEKGMYRVIIASFDNYNTAKDELINSIKLRFSDAWILTQKQ